MVSQKLSCPRHGSPTFERSAPTYHRTLVCRRLRSAPASYLRPQMFVHPEICEHLPLCWVGWQCIRRAKKQKELTSRSSCVASMRCVSSQSEEEDHLLLVHKRLLGDTTFRDAYFGIQQTFWVIQKTFWKTKKLFLGIQKNFSWGYKKTFLVIQKNRVTKKNFGQKSKTSQKIHQYKTILFSEMWHVKKEEQSKKKAKSLFFFEKNFLNKKFLISATFICQFSILPGPTFQTSRLKFHSFSLWASSR